MSQVYAFLHARFLHTGTYLKLVIDDVSFLDLIPGNSTGYELMMTISELFIVYFKIFKF